MAISNKVQIIGATVTIPQHFAVNGKQKSTFAIMVDAHVKNEAGDIVRVPQRFNIVAWEHLSKMTKNYVKNGTLIAIEGVLWAPNGVTTIELTDLLIMQ